MLFQSVIASANFLNKWLIFVAWTACILVFGAVTTRYLTNRSSFSPFCRLLSLLPKETRILFVDRNGFRIFAGLSDFKFRNFKYITRRVQKFQTCNTEIVRETVAWKNTKGENRVLVPLRWSAVRQACTRIEEIDRSSHYRAHCSVQHCLQSRATSTPRRNGARTRAKQCTGISLSSLFHNKAAVSPGSAVSTKAEEKDETKGKK